MCTGKTQSVKITFWEIGSQTTLTRTHYLHCRKQNNQSQNKSSG